MIRELSCKEEALDEERKAEEGCALETPSACQRSAPANAGWDRVEGEGRRGKNTNPWLNDIPSRFTENVERAV